ncbi:MAG TPA: acyl-CoA dehydrogenase family protein [Ignavibacteriaceae bacterium]|nr:acyl-CoA dehydrogenase family protein [Ignavibacteriaceae bacterium]
MELYNSFKGFVKENIKPFACEWDKSAEVPYKTIKKMGKAGYFGSFLPKEFGGQEWDIVTYGLLNEAVGNGMAALADLLTIQAMVSIILLKWGTETQKSEWLEQLASGKIIGGFALTEPDTGSDIQSIETEFIDDGNCFRLNGSKKWISYGQIADLFVVFGKINGKPLACILPRKSEGLEIIPINNMMGYRTAKLARLNFGDIRIPPENIIGKPGTALSLIAPVGLQYGRISTACAALGLLRACFEESISYASERKVSGLPLGDKEIIRSLLASMGTDLNAASLLCYSACRAEDEHLPEAFEKVLMAKYFSSKAAVKAASNAVQIKGAAGCNESDPVARYYRDAKIFEIIEGTSQIHESILGKLFLDKTHKEELLSA